MDLVEMNFFRSERGEIFAPGSHIYPYMSHKPYEINVMDAYNCAFYGKTSTNLSVIFIISKITKLIEIEVFKYWFCHNLVEIM